MAAPARNPLTMARLDAIEAHLLQAQGGELDNVRDDILALGDDDPSTFTGEKGETAKELVEDVKNHEPRYQDAVIKSSLEEALMYLREKLAGAEPVRVPGGRRRKTRKSKKSKRRVRKTRRHRKVRYI